jgi:hypothetical protein
MCIEEISLKVTIKDIEVANMDRSFPDQQPATAAIGSAATAYAMPGQCPVCGDGLTVVRLECGRCGTAVVGRYRTSRFARLTPEQLTFLEAFLRSRGNIRRVERDLGISYPTVRSRLSALLAALGLSAAPDEEDEATLRRRKEILDELETGAVGAEEAARRLRQIAP